MLTLARKRRGRSDGDNLIHNIHIIDLPTQRARRNGDTRDIARREWYLDCLTKLGYDLSGQIELEKILLILRTRPETHNTNSDNRGHRENCSKEIFHIMNFSKFVSKISANIPKTCDFRATNP